MLKILFLAIIVGASVVRTTRAANAETESQCREELEQELKGYVQLESWQKLFTRHIKLQVNLNGDVFSERKRLKFNTIIHNAIYGCDHNRNDEIDDCPNIYTGSVKSCKHGKNIRSAMFRAARCSFVESSVKHIVLSDILLDTITPDKLDRIDTYADRPIREYGETIVNVLSTLAHGETGGLGELMAVNLYLNNEHGTVFLHRVPAEPVGSPADLDAARRHARRVHDMILDKLYTFWDVWCGDKNVVKQYRAKYRGAGPAAVLDEMHGNAADTDDLVRSLNVAGGAGDLIDFDPRRIALADYVGGLVAAAPLPGHLAVDLRLKSFRASFEFNPRLVRVYHGHVFRTIYTCFYWTAITHLKLAVRILRESRRRGLSDGRIRSLVYIARPLTVFHVSQTEFAPRLSAAAARNVTELIAFLLDMCREFRRNGADAMEIVFRAEPAIRAFADALSADMEAAVDANVPDHYYDRMDYEGALAVMRTNYESFVRLAAAASGCKDDRKNLIKLKNSLSFLSEAIDFATD